MRICSVRKLGALATLAIVLIGALSCDRDQGNEETRPAAERSRSLVGEIGKSFQLQEEQSDRFSTRRTFTRGNEVLQLETIAEIDRESAETLIEEGIMGIEALYANALSAYPENLSARLGTPARFRPELRRKEVNGQAYRYFLLYATERLGYGASNEEMAKRRSLLGWIYCNEERALYKVKLFAPLDAGTEALERFFLALACP